MIREFEGCTPEQVRALRADSAKPIGAFLSQQRVAKFRGIEWHLTLVEWWAIWQRSGKWHQRGRRANEYVMCRRGDVGPYAVGNVVIATGDLNTSIQPNNPYRKGHPRFNEMMERLAAQRQSRAAA